MLAFPVAGVLLFLLAGGLLVLGVTYLIPRRSWPWLLIGCPVLVLWPLALAGLSR